MWTLPVGVGVQSPCDEGQASLGEALEPVRMCRLLPQPYRCMSCMSSPPQSGAIHAARIRQFFFNIIHNIVIAKDFALQ